MSTAAESGQIQRLGMVEVECRRGLGLREIDLAGFVEEDVAPRMGGPRAGATGGERWGDRGVEDGPDDRRISEECQNVHLAATADTQVVAPL